MSKIACLLAMGQLSLALLFAVAACIAGVLMWRALCANWHTKGFFLGLAAVSSIHMTWVLFLFAVHTFPWLF